MSSPSFASTAVTERTGRRKTSRRRSDFATYTTRTSSPTGRPRSRAWPGRRRRPTRSTTTASPTTGLQMPRRRRGCWRRCRGRYPRHAPTALRATSPLAWGARLTCPSLPTGVGRTQVLSVQVFGHPGVQGRAVAPDLGNSILRPRGGDPRLRRPALPVDQALVPQELGPRVILRVRRRHALELLPFQLVALLAKRGDDRNELLARAVGGNSFPESLELDVVHHVSPARGDQTLGVEGDVAPAIEVGVDVQLVR